MAQDEAGQERSVTYVTQKGTRYTLERVSSEDGSIRERWGKQNSQGVYPLEDAVVVSLKRARDLALSYKQGWIDSSQFIQSARREASPRKGEESVIVYIFRGNLLSSSLVKSAVPQ